MTLLADLKDRGENPTGEPMLYPGCVLEVDTESRQAIIVWTESLHFHEEYNGGRSVHGDGYTAPDRWSPLVDEHGRLTRAATSAVADRLAELLAPHIGNTPIEIDVTDPPVDEEPCVTWWIVTTYTDGETYDDWLDRIGWPVVATLINVTDPGTFNSAYLFDGREL